DCRVAFVTGLPGRVRFVSVGHGSVGLARLGKARGSMKQYAVIYEQGKPGQDNWGAYVPDLPGCISIETTCEEVHANIKEAIELHLEGMREDGEPIPEPTTRVGEIAIAA